MVWPVDHCLCDAPPLKSPVALPTATTFGSVMLPQSTGALSLQLLPYLFFLNPILSQYDISSCHSVHAVHTNTSLTQLSQPS